MPAVTVWMFLSAMFERRSFMLRQETTAWHEDVNHTQRGAKWQMKINDARTLLRSVYPKIKT